MNNTDDGLIEKRRWYRNSKALLGLIGAFAGAVAGIYGIAQYAIPIFIEDSVSDWNVMIVVDRSTAMNEMFDGRTKWEAVTQAVTEKLAPVAPTDNLALRAFGGPCDGGGTELLVPFGHNNRTDVISELNALEPAGQTNLADAVISAIGDFNDAERFKDRKKSIIIITGGERFCSDAPWETINQRLSKQIAPAQQRIELDMKYIGIGLAEPVREGLKKVVESTGGTADFPESAIDLERILGDQIESGVAIYVSNFEEASDPNWSTNETEISPIGQRHFLGRFSNESVELSLANLPSHSTLTVSFDLFVLDSWDGNDSIYGPDFFLLSIDGDEVVRTTFSNTGSRQAYPDDVGGDHAGATGAREQSTLGYDYYGNSVYRIVRTVPHTKDSVAVTFAASNLQSLGDESWGLGKVLVKLDRDDDTELEGTR